MYDGELIVRQQIVDAAQALARQGLSPGLSGNVSARFEDGLLITPSAIAYETLLPPDIVFIAADGAGRRGERKASTETPFHRAIYREFGGARAVIHCHSPKATALACTHQPIPAFHYMVALAGGYDIPVADYHTPGSDELAAVIVSALQERKACLLANHGQVVLGKSLEDALYLSAEVENLAAMYIDALGAGEPRILSDSEMDDMLGIFQDYRPEIPEK